LQWKWTGMNLAGAPVFRRDPKSVWTGKEVLAFDARDVNGTLRFQGAAYDPLLDRWKLLTPPLEDPAGEDRHGD
jgi:hypothetical protein